MWIKLVENYPLGLKNIRRTLIDHLNHSVVSGHRLEGHEFDWDNILILDEEPSYKKRLISEMLHISQQRKGLNVQSDTDMLDKSCIPLIKKCQK